LAATTRLECIRFSVGPAFYRYARRPQFLRSFSTRELFADFDRVDAEWLDTLIKVQQILPVAMLFFVGFGDRTYCHYYSTDARGCRRHSIEY